VQEIGQPLREALKARFGHMTADEVRDLGRLLNKMREPMCPKARDAFVREVALLEP
jgi:hypothetical protein